MDASQNARLHALLTLTGMKADKETLVKYYTNNRSGSSKDMTYIEAMHLIKHLEQSAPKHSETKRFVPKDDPEFDKKNKLRNKMLAMGYDMRWDITDPNTNTAKEDRTITVRENVDAWCRSKNSIYKKGLYEMDCTELIETVSQFEKVKEYFYKNLTKKQD